ncbi:MAG: hypothetical protein ACOC1I_03905 [Spirochaetota bacterium]
MKARNLAIVVAMGFLVSCRTTEPVWFIATPGYVEAQLAAREEAIRSDYERRIANLEAEVEQQRDVSDEVADLAEALQDVEDSNRKLQDLADTVEEELAALPEETIRLIVEVLSRHLEEGGTTNE